MLRVDAVGIDEMILWNEGDFEISTDKVDAEIPSPSEGILVEILASEGDTVSVDSVVGTIQLATFQNEAGLQATGFNLFRETDASGTPTVGNPQSDDRGATQQGFIELSNVSVVEELVNLISAQRAYEVNSKTVQTADEMLQIANNMKR